MEKTDSTSSVTAALFVSAVVLGGGADAAAGCGDRDRTGEADAGADAVDRDGAGEEGGVPNIPKSRSVAGALLIRSEWAPAGGGRAGGAPPLLLLLPPLTTRAGVVSGAAALGGEDGAEYPFVAAAGVFGGSDFVGDTEGFNERPANKSDDMTNVGLFNGCRRIFASRLAPNHQQVLSSTSCRCSNACFVAVTVCFQLPVHGCGRNPIDAIAISPSECLVPTGTVPYRTVPYRM